MPGSAAGINRLTNSLAIEFDTFMNASAGDPNHYHVSVHSRGTAANTTDESASLGLYMPANDFSEGMVHRVRIEYGAGTLRVFLDNYFTPILNVNDFTCFINRYAAGASYANCDASTVAPVLSMRSVTAPRV